MIGSMRTLVIIVSIAAIALTLYFTAYALLARRIWFFDPRTSTSYWGMGYSEVWETKLFIPAAAIESYVCKRNVATRTRNEITWRSPTR